MLVPDSFLENISTYMKKKKAGYKCGIIEEFRIFAEIWRPRFDFVSKDTPRKSRIKAGGIPVPWHIVALFAYLHGKLRMGTILKTRAPLEARCETKFNCKTKTRSPAVSPSLPARTLPSRPYIYICTRFSSSNLLGPAVLGNTRLSLASARSMQDLIVPIPFHTREDSLILH